MHYIHRQIGFCYLMVSECWLKCIKCWLLNKKDTILALYFSRINYSHTPLSKMYCCSLMCKPTAIYAHMHACKLLASGVWIRSGGLLSGRIYHEGSEPHRLPLAHPTLL